MSRSRPPQLLGERQSQGWAAPRARPPAGAAHPVLVHGGRLSGRVRHVGGTQPERVQFGVPIGRFQRVQDHIVRLVNHLDAARWTTAEALWKLDTGRPAAASVHMAKAVSSEAYLEACNAAHEVHAGMGSLTEYGLVAHTQMSRTLFSLPGRSALAQAPDGRRARVVRVYLMGGPDMAPQSPQRSGHPGKPGAPLDRTPARGPDMAPQSPQRSGHPGKPGAPLDRTPARGPDYGPPIPPTLRAPRETRGAPRSHVSSGSHNP